MPEATNMSHDSISPRFFGRNFPVFSPRYSRIALLSKMVSPSSMMTGTFALGLIARNSGECCSPLRVSTGTGSYGRPISSRQSATFIGFGAML